MKEYFEEQNNQGATIFFYALEKRQENSIEIKNYKGDLDDFPTLEYVRDLANGIPLFKDKA